MDYRLRVTSIAKTALNQCMPNVCAVLGESVRANSRLHVRLSVAVDYARQRLGREEGLTELLARPRAAHGLRGVPSRARSPPSNKSEQRRRGWIHRRAANCKTIAIFTQLSQKTCRWLKANFRWWQGRKSSTVDNSADVSTMYFYSSTAQ